MHATTMVCPNDSGKNAGDCERIDPEKLSPELKMVWRQMIAFYKTKLGFSEKKAREWTSRTINVRKFVEDESSEN